MDHFGMPEYGKLWAKKWACRKARIIMGAHGGKEKGINEWHELCPFQYMTRSFTLFAGEVFSENSLGDGFGLAVS